MGSSIRKFTEMPLQSAPALGQRVICDIPLTADLENIGIILSGSITLATAAATSLNGDGIPNLIESVELVGDGRDSIASIPFNMLCNGNMFRRKNGSVPSITQPGLTVAAQLFEAECHLDLAQFGAFVPKESSVRESQYKTLQLAFRFGATWANVFNFTTTTFTAPVISLVVTATETLELPDANGAVSSPIFKPLVSSRDDVIAVGVTRQRFRLTPDQGLRGITLRTMTSAGALTDNILKRVRVYVGKDLRLDLAGGTLKELNAIRFAGTRPTGYYYLDFADRHASPDYLNDCLDLRRALTQGADAYIEYDSYAAADLAAGLPITGVAGTISVAQWGLQSV